METGLSLGRLRTSIFTPSACSSLRTAMSVSSMATAGVTGRLPSPACIWPMLILVMGTPPLTSASASAGDATISAAGQEPSGRRGHRVSDISAFKMRKAVRTLARICDVPYQSQPLTSQLRHHMAASVAQLVEHRSRKAGVTGSSPVAGSIAQDSRLRAAFLLPILSTCVPIQTSPRRQLPYSITENPAKRDSPRESTFGGVLAWFP